MVSNEVFRGRYRKSFEKPAPIEPNKVLEYTVQPAHAELHVQEGPPHHGAGAEHVVPAHRPQPADVRQNIFEAKENDFGRATHRVYRSARYPSRVEVPGRRRLGDDLVDGVARRRARRDGLAGRWSSPPQDLPSGVFVDTPDGPQELGVLYASGRRPDGCGWPWARSTRCRWSRAWMGVFCNRRFGACGRLPRDRSHPPPSPERRRLTLRARQLSFHGDGAVEVGEYPRIPPS